MLILSVALAGLFLLLCGGFYAYRIAFFSPRKGRDHIPVTDGPEFEPYQAKIHTLFHTLNEIPCETVSIRSPDGLLLSGRYYHIRDGAPLDIGFHGYRSSPMRDFSGGSSLSFHMGHNLLLVDQRAHGKSEGRTITFGIREREDCLAWIYYTLERFGPDTKILLYGISMGAATVLMASGLSLPVNVKGIIADCPYSSPMDIILHVGRKMPIPNWIIDPFVTIGARIFGGFDIRTTTAEEAVTKATIPILLIHGESDRIVPCDMSKCIADANPQFVSRHTFPGADHGISFLTDEERYRKIVSEFTNTIFQN